MENNLGQMISAAKKNKNMSQDKLSEKLHISRQSISKWENNISLPDQETLKQLCKILDLDYILVKEYIYEYPEKQKRKKLNIILFIVLGVIIFLFIITFLFIKYRNRFEVYSIKISDNEKVQITNGIFIQSNVNYYFQLGTINFSEEEDISDYKIKIYYKTNDKLKNIIETDLQNNIILNEEYGYGEYFDENFNIDEVYIELISKTNENDVYTYKLEFNRIFNDNEMFFNKSIGTINESENSAIYNNHIKEIELLNNNYEKVDSNTYIKELENAKLTYDMNSNTFFYTRDNLNLEYNLKFNYITGSEYNYSNQAYNINYLFELEKQELHCFSENCDNYENYNDIILKELDWYINNAN